MKIHLEDEPGRSATFLLNGHLVLETFGGMPTTRDALIDQITHARRLEAFAKGFDYTLKRIKTIINIEDHINARTEAKQQQFARGLFHGMQGYAQSDSTHSYSAGHEYGIALKRWADLLRECEGIPQSPIADRCPNCGGNEFSPPLPGTHGQRCNKCCDISDLVTESQP